jgi:hypothetical protein
MSVQFDFGKNWDDFSKNALDPEKEVGGYPYEYSTRAQIISYVKGCGFELVRFYPPSTPTGCMEFVFHRTAC